MVRRPYKFVVDSHCSFDRPQSPGALLWNEKHVGHKSSNGGKKAAWIKKKSLLEETGYEFIYDEKTSPIFC